MRSMENNMGKALIAMSGGVDSSVAAALMQKEGYSCIGAMMKLHERGDLPEVCQTAGEGDLRGEGNDCSA